MTATQPPAQDVSDTALIEFSRIKLWFFRDLVDAQRKALFLLCGFSDAVTHGELDTHSAQLRALRHALRIDAARELQQAQPRNEWKEAVINELIVAHVYQKEHETNPRKAIQDAITWNCQVALDPAVSSDARALVERGLQQSQQAMSVPFNHRAAASEARQQAQVVGEWPNGCDQTVPAALRYLAAHPRPVGGEESFNAEHLYQLAREIEAATTPQSSAPVVDEAMVQRACNAYDREDPSHYGAAYPAMHAALAAARGKGGG